MLPLLACLILLSLVGDGIGNDSFQFYWHPKPLLYQQARQVCQSLGEDWTLPTGSKKYSTELADYMKRLNVKYTWLSVTKQTFKHWKWVNGSEYSGVLERSPGTNCAGVAIQGRRLRPMNCVEKGNGFVCEMPGKTPCPLKEHRQNCFTVGDTVFHLGCLTENWFYARSYCLTYGGDLAILDSAFKQHAVLNYVIERKFVQECSWIYAGLRLEDWYVQPNHSIPEDPRWGLDQPRVEHFCSRTDSQGVWWSYPCDQKSAVICQKYVNVTEYFTENSIPCKVKGDCAKPDFPWMLISLVFIVLFIFMVLVAMYLSFRRQRWRNLLKKNHGIVSSSTSIVVFSSGRIKQDKEYESKENLSILNINWNKGGRGSGHIIPRPRQIDVICKAWKKLNMESSLQIVNIYFREYDNNVFSNFLPYKYLVEILQFLLEQSGVIEAVLLPQFEEITSDTKKVLEMLWNLRAKVILVTQATKMPSLPGDDILAIGAHDVANKDQSGNVDFVIQDTDLEVNQHGAAYVTGLAAAIKVSYSNQITESRTQFIRHLFLNMISGSRSVYNGFGTLATNNITKPDNKQINHAKKSVYHEGKCPFCLLPLSSNEGPLVPSSKIKDFAKIRIGLLRPCSEPSNTKIEGWGITIKNGDMPLKERITYQDEELHTITESLLLLYENQSDILTLQKTVEIIWFSVCNEAWIYDDDAWNDFMDEIKTCHVVYVSNIMYKPSDKIVRDIFMLSQNCVVLTQALNKKGKNAPCNVPADRVISIGLTTKAMQQLRIKEEATAVTGNAESDNQPLVCKEDNQNPDILHMTKRGTTATVMEPPIKAIQSCGSTLDFLCGLEFVDGNNDVKPAHFQAVAVVSMILIKAVLLGVETNIMRCICTTPVMHAILRRISSHPHYHSMDDGWGELDPLPFLRDNKTFKTILKFYAQASNENKYWAGKNV